jgi:hypothetical protein
MKRSLTSRLVASLVALLTGCASAPKPQEYRDEKPVLDLKTYFVDTVDASSASGWARSCCRSGSAPDPSAAYLSPRRHEDTKNC